MGGARHSPPKHRIGRTLGSWRRSLRGSVVVCNQLDRRRGLPAHRQFASESSFGPPTHGGCRPRSLRQRVDAVGAWRSERGDALSGAAIAAFTQAGGALVAGGCVVVAALWRVALRRRVAPGRCHITDGGVFSRWRTCAPAAWSRRSSPTSCTTGASWRSTAGLRIERAAYALCANLVVHVVTRRDDRQIRASVCRNVQRKDCGAVWSSEACADDFEQHRSCRDVP